MKKIILLLLTISIFLPAFVFAQNDDLKLTGAKLIKSEDLMNSVEYFASPELQGRLAGSDGYYKAANYVSDIFFKLGLITPFNNSYYQKFLVEYNEIKAPCKFFAKSDNEDNYIYYKLGDDFVCRSFSGSGNFEAPIVFCGYGMADEKIDYDDYYSTDVNGKIVMIFKQDCSWNQDWKGNGNLRYKALAAAKHGAKAIIFVSKPNDKEPQKPIGSVLDGVGEHLDNFPMIHVNLKIADEILKTSGFTIKELQTKIDSEKKPNSIELKTIAGIEIHAEFTKEKETMNVVGLLEGSDTILRHECVIIGAHLDHVGEQAGEIYFPGANDNASGSAALLEIAKAFVNSGIKPKRSIFFILFSSEEAGLFGAQHYADNPIYPLDKTVAMFNLDCIGYGDSIRIGNGESAPELYKYAQSNDEEYIRTMVKGTWKGGGADASPFHEKGIPCLYFVTTNSYDNLHLPSDKPETLNKNLFQRITQLAYLTLFDIADGKYTREEVKK
jgi:hypothetical protein